MNPCELIHWFWEILIPSSSSNEYTITHYYICNSLKKITLNNYNVDLKNACKLKYQIMISLIKGFKIEDFFFHCCNERERLLINTSIYHFLTYLLGISSLRFITKILNVS